MKEIRLSGRPKAKVSRLKHPGALRAQPCNDLIIKSSGYSWLVSLSVVFLEKTLNSHNVSFSSQEYSLNGLSAGSNC